MPAPPVPPAPLSRRLSFVFHAGGRKSIPFPIVDRGTASNIGVPVAFCPALVPGVQRGVLFRGNDRISRITRAPPPPPPSPPIIPCFRGIVISTARDLFRNCSPKNADVLCDRLGEGFCAGRRIVDVEIKRLAVFNVGEERVSMARLRRFNCSRSLLEVLLGVMG